MSEDEAMRQASIDATLYGIGLVKVTHDAEGFHYTRLDPTEVKIQNRPKQNYAWIDPDDVEEV